MPQGKSPEVHKFGHMHVVLFRSGKPGAAWAVYANYEEKGLTRNAPVFSGVIEKSTSTYIGTAAQLRDIASAISCITHENETVLEAEPKLKPCPLCGGKVKIVKNYGFLITCRACQIDMFSEWESDCIATWNTRALRLEEGAIPISREKELFSQIEDLRSQIKRGCERGHGTETLLTEILERLTLWNTRK